MLTIKLHFFDFRDPKVPTEIQEENGVQFQYKIYQNPDYVDEN